MSLAEQLGQADRCADAARIAVDAAKQLAKELQSKISIEKKKSDENCVFFLKKLWLPKSCSLDEAPDEDSTPRWLGLLHSKRHRRANYLQ